MVTAIMLLISLIKCDPNSLGKDYYYMDEYEALDIGYPFGQTIYKSENKSYIQEEKVPANVIEVEHNYRYIIAKQVYNKEIELNILKEDLARWDRKYNTKKYDSVINFKYGSLSLKKIHKVIKENNSNLDRFIDSIISHSTYYKELLTPNKINYYIIDKDNDSVLGPLTKEEFDRIKKEKGINLKFEEK